MISFIVGVGRSGTSLLQSILSSHSKIAMPPETGFLRKAVFSLKKHEDISFEKFTAQYSRLSRLSLALFENHPDQFVNDLNFYRYLLEQIVSKEEVEIAGDKDPKLIEYMSGTATLFPDAKFIHLVRDPRDVLLSKKKAAWSEGKPSWYHIFANYVQLKMGELQGHKFPEKKYLTITYGNLLAKPKETIAQVCNFLNVEFEESMLSFQEKAKELVSKEEQQWKAETMGPLLKDNTGKWEGKLTDHEVALTERLCEQAFNIGGYEESNALDRLSLIAEIWIILQSIFLKAGGYLYMWSRLLVQKLLVKWKY